MEKRKGPAWVEMTDEEIEEERLASQDRLREADRLASPLFLEQFGLDDTLAAAAEGGSMEWADDDDFCFLT